MVKVENDCVGPCPQGCMGSECPYQHTQHFYCDECGDEVGSGKLYEFSDGRQLCEQCVLDNFTIVE